MGLIKSHSDLRCLKEAGRIVKEVLQALCEASVHGASTIELELLANRLLGQNRSSAPFKGFDGFNHAICVSLNEEIVNGPPSRERHLQQGDIVSIATAAEHRGIHAKAARTIYIGSNPSDEMKRLLEGTALTIEHVIQSSKKMETLNEILQVVPETARQYQLTIIKNLGGAGIGKKLHELPLIPNDPAVLTEVLPLQPGLSFTLMPMFSLGESDESDTHEDGWTFVTHDKALSAHFADTLRMGEDGLENITGS